MIWGKQKHLEALLAEYQNEIRATVSEMIKTLEKCSGDYDSSFLKDSVRDVHLHERKADDIRREIEVLMYAKALFPESRGDILALVESIDRIANQSEKAVWMMQTHHLTIPPAFQPGILTLAKVSAEAASELLEASAKLFTNYKIAAEFLGKVDQLESEADRIEATLTEQVFLSDLEGVRKILMRDLIHNLAQVSDRAHNVADRIRIIIAKRSI